MDKAAPVKDGRPAVDLKSETKVSEIEAIETSINAFVFTENSVAVSDPFKRADSVKLVLEAAKRSPSGLTCGTRISGSTSIDISLIDPPAVKSTRTPPSSFDSVCELAVTAESRLDVTLKARGERKLNDPTILVSAFKAVSLESSEKFWSSEFTVNSSPSGFVIEISNPSDCTNTMREPSCETSAVIPVCSLR